MITFNIDKNNRLVDFISVASWSYYSQNKELRKRIFNILNDLTQGSFDNEQIKDIIDKSVKGETAIIENDSFIMKTVTNRYDQLRIAVFEDNKNFNTVKYDIAPNDEQKIREQFGIE